RIPQDPAVELDHPGCADPDRDDVVGTDLGGQLVDRLEDRVGLARRGTLRAVLDRAVLADAERGDLRPAEVDPDRRARRGPPPAARRRTPRPRGRPRRGHARARGPPRPAATAPGPRPPRTRSAGGSGPPPVAGGSRAAPPRAPGRWPRARPGRDGRTNGV